MAVCVLVCVFVYCVFVRVCVRARMCMSVSRQARAYV